MGAKPWISLVELALGNLAWIDTLDLHGYVVATGLAIVAGALLWIFVGPVWLLVGASLYLGLLVAVRILANRGRDDGEPPQLARE